MICPNCNEAMMLVVRKTGTHWTCDECLKAVVEIVAKTESDPFDEYWKGRKVSTENIEELRVMARTFGKPFPASVVEALIAEIDRLNKSLETTTEATVRAISSAAIAARRADK